MISTEEIQRIAKLASLAIDEGETEGYRIDLETVLDQVEKLRELDLADIDVDIKSTGRTREDIATTSLAIEKVFFNAAEMDKGFFCVPQTVK